MRGKCWLSRSIFTGVNSSNSFSTNHSGVITGLNMRLSAYVLNGGGLSGITFSPAAQSAPEPGTLEMLAMGLGGLWLARRRLAVR